MAQAYGSPKTSTLVDRTMLFPAPPHKIEEGGLGFDDQVAWYIEREETA